MGVLRAQTVVQESTRPKPVDNTVSIKDFEFEQWAKQRTYDQEGKRRPDIDKQYDGISRSISSDDTKESNNFENTPFALKNTTQNAVEQISHSPEFPNVPKSSDHVIPSIETGSNISSSSPTNVLVWGTVLKQPTKLLVDTGAAVTVISDTYYHDILRPVYELKRNEQLESVKTANGKSVPVTGSVSFPVMIGQLVYTFDAAIVPGLAYDIVLGRDFLHKFSAVIDVRGQTVKFYGDNTVFFANGDAPPHASEVRAAQTVVIDAHSESVIPVYLRTSPPEPVIGLIEAIPKLSDRYQLFAASSVSCCNESGKVSFRPLNPTEQPVLLHKGTTIGQFLEHNPDDIIFSLDPEPSTSSVEPSAPMEAKKEFLSRFASFPSQALSDSENEQLADLLENYADIFASSSLDLGRTSIVQHTIDTGDARPIKQSPYRASQAQRAEIETHISNMLEQGIIKVSSSPWSSPVVLVKKKDGSTRFCVDDRKLNAVTRKDSYPLPRIDDVLDSLTGSKYFTTLDLQSGYHQVAMSPDSQDKTAFVTHAGVYSYDVMSFGLCNAPPCFQRLMSRVLHGLEWRICLVYIDDVIVFAPSLDEHLSRLQLVFDRLRQANLKLKPSKCYFAKASVNFLGFVVSAAGISPDPEKISAVKSFPTPKSVKDIRSFLGLANYYRRFVHNFAKIASPLNRLTRKDVPFVWTPECEGAFLELKRCLCSPPILAYPDFSQPFHLDTDASNSALGYILGQSINGQECVIAYGGRELSHAETNYSTTEREALAVVDGVKRYQSYLSGTKFFIHTDHGSLSWLMRIKDPTGRLARWALQLQQYDFEIIHRAGTANGNADALSRRSYVAPLSVSQETPVKLPLGVIEPPCPPAATLYTLQRQDPDLVPIIQYLETAELPLDDSEARFLLLQIDSYYLDDNGILCHLWTPGKRHVQPLCSQVVIPASLRHEVLSACHDAPTASHFSTHKTYEKIRRRYFWHGMFKDVEHWCKTCVDCAMKKVPRGKRKAPLLPIPVEGAFDRVAMDILGPLPVTNDGNRYIIVFSDYYTRWPEAFALPSIEAPRIAQLLVDEIVARHSAPRTLLSDRGSNFLVAIVKEVCKIINTRSQHTTAYHPQTDGLVERFNATLTEGLSMYVSSNQKDWDQHIPMILFAYRVSPNATTGESPFYLLYGREPRLPVDAALLLPTTNLSPSVAQHRARIVQNLEEAQQIISSNTQLAQQRMKLQYDKNSAPVHYEIGSKVWVYTPKTKKGLSKKLSHNFHGPYRIVNKLSPVHFKLRTLDNRVVSVPVHANRLKPFYDPADRPIDPLPPTDDSSPDLPESDLPPDSFTAEELAANIAAEIEPPNESNAPSTASQTGEPVITRPEDIFTPQTITYV